MLKVGIDLGTTFSAAAVINDQGIPALVPDVEKADAFLTPSVVHVGEDGALVGNMLEAILADEPALPHARFFKLHMGEARGVFRDHAGRDWWAPALSALVLRKLLADIEAFTNENIGAAVITVPANFSDAERRATRDAAILAGIPRVKLMEEPVAAARYYGFEQPENDRTCFVYDLGGGTFDATVLQSADTGLYALATGGSNRLGGKWIDDIVINAVLDEFERQHSDRPHDPASLQQVRRFAVDAKLQLSKPGNNRVSKTLLVGGRTLDFVLTQDHFNNLAEQLIEETLKVCETVLAKKNLDWSMVDTLLLTGGSSLLPMVARKLAVVSKQPVDAIRSRQPHQAVAYGAALLAEQLFADSGTAASLQQICSHDLGVRAIDPETRQPGVRVLIARNTPVPASQRLTFYTTRTDQARMIVEVVQVHGEGSARMENSLGHFAFGPIETPRKNYPVEIELGYDVDGMVSARAFDPATGKEIRQIMEQHGGAMPGELLEQQHWVRALSLN